MFKQCLVRLASITCLALLGLLMLGPVAPVLAMPHFDSAVLLKSEPVIMTTGIDQNPEEEMNPIEDTSGLDDAGDEKSVTDLIAVHIKSRCTGVYYDDNHDPQFHNGSWRLYSNKTKLKCVNIPHTTSNMTRSFRDCRIVPVQGGPHYQGRVVNNGLRCREN